MTIKAIITKIPRVRTYAATRQWYWRNRTCTCKSNGQAVTNGIYTKIEGGFRMNKNGGSRGIATIMIRNSDQTHRIRTIGRKGEGAR